MLRNGALFVFRSTHDVLAAEDVLTAADVGHHVIPKPRVIKADCGLAIFVALSAAQAAEQAIRDADIPVSGVHEYSRPRAQAR